MARAVRLATIQPPYAYEGVTSEDVIARGLEYLRRAGEEGADAALLPECFNVVGCRSLEEGRHQVTQGRERLVAEAADIAASAGMYVVLPTYELCEGHVRNSAIILDRTGRRIGRYVKVHVVPKEKQDYGVAAGDGYPTFSLDFGCVGIMICYDAYFPEVARILALAGAEIIFFPSLQRSYGEQNVEIQVRARALDNAVHIVRSSYGVREGQPWTVGKIAGLSCIVNDEGRIIANVGKHEGFTTAAIDLDQTRVCERSHGGEVGRVREFLIEDRRPDTYGALTRRADH